MAPIAGMAAQAILIPEAVQSFDEIVIGSGLAALAVVMGLPACRRVLVVSGPAAGRYTYYGGDHAAPCAYLGLGGLGNAWHGVIPMALHPRLAPDRVAFTELLEMFYPGSGSASRIGRDLLFVPRRPIRPRERLNHLVRQRAGKLALHADFATRIEVNGARTRVHSGNAVFEAGRVWVAAGAMHTPGLLERSLGIPLARHTVADHALCYVGYVDGLPPVSIDHVAAGMYIPAYTDAARTTLYTLRPARFSFRKLDQGIEERAAFGLPTSGVVAKVFRAMSSGLVAEALYNRFGLFPRARRYSIYAQIDVADAYEPRQTGDDDARLEARLADIRVRTDSARAAVPFESVVQSRRGDLYMPGIHLHHSVDTAALQSAGINMPDSPIQIVDASAMERIGPEHHSFRMMVAAWIKARASG